MNNIEQAEGQVANARTEMLLSRTVEMVCESIPGTVIQAMALFSKGGDRSWIAVASLLFCLSTTVFFSTKVSYEWETSEVQREYDPTFYGYLPLRGWCLKYFSDLFFVSC